MAWLLKKQSHSCTSPNTASWMRRYRTKIFGPLVTRVMRLARLSPGAGRSRTGVFSQTCTWRSSRKPKPLLTETPRCGALVPAEEMVKPLVLAELLEQVKAGLQEVEPRMRPHLLQP